MKGCLSCWRVAAASTHIYTRRGGQPVTTVGLYRERHAEHLRQLADGQRWWNGERWEYPEQPRLGRTEG